MSKGYRRRSHHNRGPDNSIFYIFLVLALIFIGPSLLSDLPVITNPIHVNPSQILPSVTETNLITTGSTVTIPINWEVTQGTSKVKTSLNSLSVLTGTESFTSIKATATLDYQVQGTILDSTISGNMQMLFDGIVKKTIPFSLPITYIPPVTIGTITVTSTEIEAWAGTAYGDHTLMLSIPSGGTFTVGFSSGGHVTVDILGSQKSLTVTVEAPPSGFIESCDTYNSIIWGYEYEQPTASGGAWVMNFPSGVRHSYRPISKSFTKFGYGHYRITFQTSGSKDPGVNYGIFFYYDGGGVSGKYNELDIPEVRGFHSGNSLSISCYRNMDKGLVDLGVQQPVYQYWTSYKDCNDGQVHTFEFNWLPTKLEFFVDGALDYTWLEGKPGMEGGAQPHIPVPPMYFYPFGASGQSSKDYWVKCLQIEYAPT